MAHRNQLLRHLTVCVNGTVSSLAAFEYGLRLAKVSHAKIEAVLIEDIALPEFTAFLDAHSRAKLVADASLAVGSAADELQQQIVKLARNAGVVAMITRDRGSFYQRVVEYAVEASMLIIGRSSHWSSGGLLGSNSECVVRQVRKPILIAPAAFHEPNAVLVAYAAKNLGSLVLQSSADLAVALGLPLRVLTVHSDRNERARIRGIAEQELEAFEGAIEFIEDEGSAADRIVAQSSEDTILVMGAYGRARVYRLILGSVTARVMRESRGPVVLSAKPRE